MICLLCPVLCLLAKNTPLSSACCTLCNAKYPHKQQQPILAGCSRTAMSCAKSYCYVRAGQWQCCSPGQILPGLGWAGWLRNVWRCDDTCELLGWLGWAGLGWARLSWVGLSWAELAGLGCSSFPRSTETTLLTLG